VIKLESPITIILENIFHERSGILEFLTLKTIVMDYSLHSTGEYIFKYGCPSTMSIYQSYSLDQVMIQSFPIGPNGTHIKLP
jgi:hypothetical protein